MNCPVCGGELRENAKFCSHCGSSQPEQTEDIKENAVEKERCEETVSDTDTAEEISETQAETPDEELSDENDACDDVSEETSEIKEKFDEKDGIFIVKDSVQPAPEITESVPEEENFRYIPPVRKMIAAAIFVVVAVTSYAIPTAIIPAARYTSAEKLYSDGKFSEAEAVFNRLGDYKDCGEYIMKCRYGAADALFDEGKFSEAADAFSALDGYSDSYGRIEECILKTAEEHIANGDYESAMAVYAAAGKNELAEETALRQIEALAAEGNYGKAAELAEKYCSDAEVTEYLYLGAMTAKNDGDFKTAANAFGKLGDYKDSASQALDCAYSYFRTEYTQNGASEEIVRGFFSLGDYRDSADLFVSSAYDYGISCAENEKYDIAAAMFRNAGSYKDSAAQLHKARYNLGKSLIDSDPESARSVFALLSTYSDSAAQKKIAAKKIPDDHSDWYADGYTQAGGYFTINFRKTDTLIINCTAGTDKISHPVTLTLTLRDSEGKEVSADCENVRNSGYFSGSFSLTDTASGDAQIIVTRKDNSAVLRTFEITIE